MTTENRQILGAMAQSPEVPPTAFIVGEWPRVRKALLWALEQTQEPAPPPGGWTDLVPDEQKCMDILLEMLTRVVPPGWESKDVLATKAIQWALPILRRAVAEPTKQDIAIGATRDPRPTTEDLYGKPAEWVPTLAALAKRELRFWKEAGRVSGDVTRRAASRAIEGLEQVLHMIPANLRS